MPHNLLSTRNVRVFVSSTFTDLEPIRERAQTTIERLRGTEFVGMELFGTRPESAHEVSLEEVDDADLYVGIIGGRWGSGITEAEYRRAREKQLDCLFYVMKEEAIEIRDDEAEKRERRAAWLQEIRDSFTGHVVFDFRTADDLEKQIPIDLHNWLYQRLVRDARAAAAEGQLQLLRTLGLDIKRQDRLRQALIDSGIAVGDDLMETLIALSPASTQRLADSIRIDTRFGTNIEKFLQKYLGTPDQPVPFGGRSDVLEQLDAWVRDDAQPPYALIAEDSGRGKTAVLVRWSRMLMTDETLAVVFVPVSIRYHTNFEAVFFKALVTRLASVHGIPLNQQATPAETWRGLAGDLLRKPLPDGRRLVVIIDGLDEAADWEAGPDLFPAHPSAGVRLLVSARLTAKFPTPHHWQEQLDWPAKESITIPLNPLTREGVRDVVERMGYPLADLAEETLDHLYRLSEGDPLLVTLYVEKLLKRGSDAARLTPEELEQIKPGLEGYFEDWWNDQRTLWGRDAPLKEEGVRAILNLLSCALGPLKRTDLITLSEGTIDRWTLDDSLDPIERFVIDDEEGLIFNHPRFAQYQYKQLGDAAAKWESRMVIWGKRELKKLTAGEIAPGEISPYLVQYYTHHLERMKEPADDMLAVLIPEWRQAWQRLQGGLSGLLADVHRAWRRVSAEDDRLMQKGGKPARLADEIYCALCSASIRSLTENIPPELVKRLLEEKIWTGAQALAYARNTSEAGPRFRALLAAADYLDGENRAAAMEEAREAIEHMLRGENTTAFATLVATGFDPKEVPENQAPDVARELVKQGFDQLALAVIKEGDLFSAGAIAESLLDRGELDKAIQVVAGRYASTHVLFRLSCAATLAGVPVPESILNRFQLDRHLLERFIAMVATHRMPQETDADVLEAVFPLATDSVEVARCMGELLADASPETIEVARRVHVGVHSPVENAMVEYLLTPRAARAEVSKEVFDAVIANPLDLYATRAIVLIEDHLDDQRLATAIAAVANTPWRPLFEKLTDFARQRGKLPLVVNALKDQESAPGVILPLLEPGDRELLIRKTLDDLQKKLDATSLEDSSFEGSAAVLAPVAPYLHGQAILDAIRIADRIGDKELLGLVIAVLTATPESAIALAERYGGRRQRTNLLFAIFASGVRREIVDHLLNEVRAGRAPREDLDEIAVLATMIGEADGAHLRNVVWQEIAATPKDLLASHAHREATPPAELLATLDAEAIAAAGREQDPIPMTAWPWLPPEERRAEIERRVATDASWSDFSDLSPFVASSLTAGEAALIFRTFQRMLFESGSALEALMPLLPQDCVEIVREFANGEADADEHNAARRRIGAITALLPHAGEDERRRLIDILLTEPTLFKEVQDYFVECAVIRIRPFTSREQVMQVLGAQLTLDRVRRLFQASADDTGDNLFTLAAFLRMKEWPSHQIPALIRLLISPEYVIARQKLVLGLVALRDDLERFDGPQLSSGVASAIERAAVMFP
jgi:hypothetical protein